MNDVSQRQPWGIRLLHAVLREPDWSATTADDLDGRAPALVVMPTLDPPADHGRRYAERLLESGAPARLTEHPGAPHAFLGMPGLAPQAKAARTETTEFLGAHLKTKSTKVGER
jgi:acetyl esterase/lipase